MDKTDKIYIIFYNFPRVKGGDHAPFNLSMRLFYYQHALACLLFSHFAAIQKKALLVSGANALPREYQIKATSNH